MFDKKSQMRFLLDVLLRVGLAALLLSACSSPSNHPPLQILDVSVTPEPQVGQIAVLSIQIQSTQDEPDVVFLANVFDETDNIHLVSGEPEWTGALTADQPRTIQLEICVLREGSWPIEIQTASRLSNNKFRYNAVETIHIESTTSSGRLIRNWEYTFSQGDWGGVN